jgi:hypothetical protein
MLSQLSRILSFIMLLPLVVQNSLAQQICDFDDQMLSLQKADYAAYQKVNKSYYDALKAIYAKNKQTYLDTTIRVPVYFHVLYRANQVVSNEQLDEAISFLNEGFNAQTDTSSVRDVFKERVANVGIEFYRAITDINGDTITRTNKRFSIVEFNPQNINAIKREEWGLKPYYPKHYLNIWIGSTPGLLGHGTPPRGAANWENLTPFPDSLQGIVLNRSMFIDQSYKGRNSHILTHEVGHYLGLRHVWGDGLQMTSGDSIHCYKDDGIYDTPQSFSPSFSCDYSKNTCGINNPNDLPDIIENFMDYTPSDCRVMFTQDQKALMLYNLYTFRPELIRYRVDTLIATPSAPKKTANLRIIPNPNQGSFKLKFYGLRESTGNLRIYSLQGKELVHTPVLFNAENNFAYPFLQAGIYLLEIENELGEIILAEKLVIHH